MNKVVSISHGLQVLLVNGGMVSSDKVIVIPYGFDFDDIVERTKLGELRYSDSQIIIAGRLVPYKQHHLVLKIMPLLIKKFPNLQLLIVGAGPMEGEFKQMSQSLNIQDHVRWEGFRSNIHDYIRDSDLMVFPSTSEGFGLVILEAWQHAKPVVAFDVPAPNEIITDKEDGRLVKPFDTQSLFDTISELLSNTENLQNMGRQGYKTLKERHSLNVMCDKTQLLYAQVIADKNKA